MKHLETHPDFVEGCFGCKLTTLTFNTSSMKREREGRDVTNGRGTREYVRDMYEKRRAAGMEDPIPENKKSAAFAPAKGVFK